MKRLFYLLIISISLGACNKDEDKIEIETLIPTVDNIEVTGNQLKLTWSHEKDMNDVQYEIKLNENVYSNPSYTFIKKLEYDTNYSGEIIAKYANEETTSVDFEFTTQKSKMLFFSTWSGTLYAVDLYTKNIIWQHDSTSSGYNPHLSYDSLIITGTDKIRAFNIYTGKVEWRIEPYSGFSTNFTSVLEDNTLYVEEYNQDKTIAISLETKEISWQSFFEGSHLVLGDQAYVTNSFSAPDLVSLDKLSGNYNWGFNLDPNNTSAAAVISSQPVLFENNLYFGDNIGRIYSVNANSGEKNWSKDLGLFQESYGAPIIHNNHLLIPVENKIYAINPTTSVSEWIYSCNLSYYGNYAHINSAPFVYENKLIACAEINGNSRIFSIDADNGNLVWEKDFDETIKSSPIVFENSVFIGSWNNKLYEIDMDNGNIIKEFTVNNKISNPPVIIIGIGEEVIYPNTCGMQ